MAKAEHNSDARVLVGIDISKNRHEVLIAVPGKARRRRMTVLNTSEDYRRLIDALREPYEAGQGSGRTVEGISDAGRTIRPLRFRRLPQD